MTGVSDKPWRHWRQPRAPGALQLQMRTYQQACAAWPGLYGGPIEARPLFFLVENFQDYVCLTSSRKFFHLAACILAVFRSRFLRGSGFRAWCPFQPGRTCPSAVSRLAHRTTTTTSSVCWCEAQHGSGHALLPVVRRGPVGGEREQEPDQKLCAREPLQARELIDLAARAAPQRRRARYVVPSRHFARLRVRSPQANAALAAAQRLEVQV